MDLTTRWLVVIWATKSNIWMHFESLIGWIPYLSKKIGFLGISSYFQGFLKGCLDFKPNNSSLIPSPTTLFGISLFCRISNQTTPHWFHLQLFGISLFCLMVLLHASVALVKIWCSTIFTKKILSPSQIVSPLFYFGMFQNKAFFEKSLNKIFLLSIILFKKSILLFLLEFKLTRVNLKICTFLTNRQLIK